MMKKLLAAAVCGAFAASALAAMPEKVTIVYVKSPFQPSEHGHEGKRHAREGL